ncbi:MAG: cytosine permease [Pseudonocardiales bacterium]|nr:MAG: cytosine permease [Pseudonocardiales bacterium]
MTPIQADVREGEYGERVLAVEPGGAELIPLSERHGTPLQLFWTWMSPNLEFATIYVGVLAVAVFGLSFWQAVLAIVLGTGLGALTQGLLSARGPAFGVPQMVLSRISFGYLGNVLPAGLNAVTASMGWFAVNSVSGALALAALTHMSKVLSLVIIVAVQLAVAFFGHNLVHVFERYAFPALAVVFAVATVIILSKAHLGAGGKPIPGAFLITVGATFGYAAGWNPYAADYTRYLPPSTSRRAVGRWAGLGVFVSCVVLEVVGAASATLPGKGNPTEAFTSQLPSLAGKLTLLAIALGAVAANVINVYSGAMSFLAMGIRLPLALRRAIIAVAAGTVGFVLALNGLNDPSKYENFLLVIAYWIGPWLGVYLTDWYLRSGNRVDGFLFDRRHNPWAGPVAMLIAMAVSILLFANQVKYTGLVPKHYPKFGDIAFEVGFVLAAALYYGFYRLQHDRKSEELVMPAAA